MRRTLSSRVRWVGALALAAVLAAVLAGTSMGAGNPGLRSLIVGGGPEPSHNEVAIERNVYYVSRLLPAGVPRFTLFADGDPASKTVLFQEEPRELSPGERAFFLLFGGRGDTPPVIERYRVPQLGRLDGGARRADVERGFAWLRRGEGGPVLLYFTGHGSQERRNPDNNHFDLWGGEPLSVRDLAAQVATLPPDVSVTLVMVQCYAGAFGNLIFEGGDPAGAPVERTIAGFFAAPRERPAAGCTPELNEAEYHDFTSYFFAALTGRDRVGRAVTGADYNQDGRVGMDEAYAYTLAHDVSIDVPVCTSDVFLRRFVSTPDEEIFQTEYSKVRAWATRAQVAALDQLSRDLQLTGEGRLAEAYRRMAAGGQSRRREAREARRRFGAARQEARRWLLDRWPALQQRDRVGYAAARSQAVAELERRAADGQLAELLAAEKALVQIGEQAFQEALEEARVLRFVRLGKSVVLAQRLRESGDAATRARFERLAAAEAGPLLPPAPRTARRPAGAAAR